MTVQESLTINPFIKAMLHILPTLIFLLIVAILTDARWYLIVILMCLSLRATNVEHLFMCLLAIIFLGEISIYDNLLNLFQ